MTLVTLDATVSFRGTPRDGSRVRFTANAPVLFENVEDTMVTVTGARPEGEAEISVTTVGGLARAYMIAPREAMQLVVTASYTNANRTAVTGELVFEVGEPPLVSAGQVNDALRLTAERFQIACAASNVGGFIASRPDIRVPCTLILREESGRDVPHTPVDFFVEAGTIEDAPATADTPRRFTYVIPSSPAELPRNVGTSFAEDGSGLVEAGVGLVPGGLEQNPRDGLVTILAVARGNEAFVDTNGNGTHDPGELFQDEGEPFLDVDDDGVFDPTIDPPHCCDTNGNGQVDGPNGQWDAGILLGRMTHVLWSGPISGPRSGIFGNSVIEAEGGQTYTVRVMDANFNPVAALDDNDELTLTVSPANRLDFDPVGCPAGAPGEGTVTNVSGLVMQRYPDFVFGRGDAVFLDLSREQSFLVGREWCFRLIDGRSAASSSLCMDINWTADATLEFTPGIESSGFSFDTLSDTVTTGGQLLAKPDPCP